MEHNNKNDFKDSKSIINIFGTLYTILSIVLLFLFVIHTIIFKNILPPLLMFIPPSISIILFIIGMGIKKELRFPFKLIFLIIGLSFYTIIVLLITGNVSTLSIILFTSICILFIHPFIAHFHSLRNESNIFVIFINEFKIMLPILSVLYSLLLIINSQFIFSKYIKELRSKELRPQVELCSELYSLLCQDDSIGGLSILFDMIIKKNNFPLVLTDIDKTPTAWHNISVNPDDRTELAIEEVKRIVGILEQKNEPIPVRYENEILGYFYFGDPKSIKFIIEIMQIIFITMIFLIIITINYFIYINQKKL